MKKKVIKKKKSLKVSRSRKKSVFRRKIQNKKKTPVAKKKNHIRKPKIRIPGMRPIGKKSDDIEVFLGRVWVVASSVLRTHVHSMHWKMPALMGNCPLGMWRWKK